MRSCRVMSCDWSPTGRDFVSASYDRTLRLWKQGEGKSRDTYHTKRMQRYVRLFQLAHSPLLASHELPADLSVARSVFSTLYTLDSRFVLSGSDDANLRIWKARASEKLGVVDKREQVRKEYRDGLREKWGTVADVAKIERCVERLLALWRMLFGTRLSRVKDGRPASSSSALLTLHVSF